MPEKTVEAWRNLWFHTGDRVVRESDGFFRFMDRMKDAIRRRGENISSYEVEQVLVSHPQVENAAVFPVRSELAEDEVMAAVVLRPGEKLAYEALLDYCQPRMPYFAVPRYLEFVECAAGDRKRQGHQIQAARTRHHRRDVGPRPGGLQGRPQDSVLAQRGPVGRSGPIRIDGRDHETTDETRHPRPDAHGN